VESSNFLPISLFASKRDIIFFFIKNEYSNNVAQNKLVAHLVIHTHSQVLL
jgi:hypothetical protein